MRLKSLRSSAVCAGHTLSVALWVSSIIVHACDDGELNFETTKRMTGPSGGQKVMNSVKKNVVKRGSQPPSKQLTTKSFADQLLKKGGSQPPSKD